MRQTHSNLREKILRWDSDETMLKLALYEGDRAFLSVFSGSIVLNNKEYLVSLNLPDGSVIRVTVVRSRDPSYDDSILITDILRYGKSDLSSVTFKLRYEVLSLICSPMPEEYGFKLFGGRCVAPYVFVATPVTADHALKAHDARVLGFEAVGLNSLSETTEVLKESDDRPEWADSVEKYPPVENEAARVLAYKPLVRSMIKKITGKWKDAYLSNHQASQLPYDADDLMQFGLMQVTIALRKYKVDNPQRAQEQTFVYGVLWSRFGQIAHKFGKQSSGYGVPHVRDFINDEGNLVCAYDFYKSEDGE